LSIGITVIGDAPDAMSIEEAKRADPFGKGGGLLDGELVREFPLSIR
jgi:hypothetical protein